MRDRYGYLMRRGDQQDGDALNADRTNDSAEYFPAFGIQAQEWIVQNQQAGIPGKSDGELHPLVLPIGELDKGFGQQLTDMEGLQPFACHGIGPGRVFETIFIELLFNGRGPVGIGGVESLLIIKIFRAYPVFKTMLLLDDRYFRGMRIDLPGVKMPAHERMCEYGLTASGRAGEGPLFATAKGEVDRIQNGYTP